MHKHMANLKRCQTLRSDMQILVTAEIMQNYDLKEFSIVQTNGSTLLKIPRYYTA